MKKISTILLGLSLLTSGVLYAHGNTIVNEQTNEMSQANNHMGNHMHNGKMTNHTNANGMTDKEMKEMSQADNNHMGDHMHNGVMSNHANTGGMTDTQMKKNESN